MMDNYETQENTINKLLLEPGVSLLIEFLSSITKETYLVGGAIRDLFLGNKINDLDFATPIHAEDLYKELKNANFKVIETGISHGTLTVVIKEKQFEITTFREAGSRDSKKYSDNIKTDLSARDFTINSIAWNVYKNEFIDPYDGILDLNKKILRSPISANDRIIEDPLRILRMLRFGPANDFTCEETLLSACTDNAKLLSQISVERIQTELNHILLSKDSTKAFRLAKDLDLFKHFLPEIIPSIGCAQNDFHIEDVFEHTLTVIRRAPEDNLLLKHVALFHDLGKPKTLSIGEDGNRHFYKHELESELISKNTLLRLKYSKRFLQRVAKLVAYHMRPLDCGPAGVRRLIRDLGDDFNNWLKFKIADKPPTMSDDEFKALYDSFVKKWKTEKSKAKTKPFGKLAVSGNDLQKIGFKIGPDIGITLKKLEESVLDNPSLNNYDELIKLAKKFI